MTDNGHFIEPVTGELLPATDENLRAARRATHDEISRLRAAVAPVQEEIAVRAGPATLPARRGRSPLQEQVAACPRCGGPLADPFPDESAGALS